MADLKSYLSRLQENLNILREREAKYAGNVPVDLLNQISDHMAAIELTEQAIGGELAKAEWQQALEPLLVAIEKHSDKASNGVTIGDVYGDIYGSKIAGRDIVEGDIHVHIHPSPLPPAEAQTRRDLNILLKNVETSWIKGVLEKLVHHAVLLDLGKEVRADPVDHPWEMILERPDQADRPLPAGTKISAVFAETPLLLILGEPGSGKTITLLELARDLIARFRADPTFAQPVPVVFNLLTWTNNQQPLSDWVVGELNSLRYRVPKEDGRSWLEQRRILPLLDGLDEVKRENRMACVEAINQFVMDYGLQELVVCSRIEDYTALPVRLKFYGAIYIRPLADGQIDQYLVGAAGKLETLRDLLQQDEHLRTLARTPLMLNIMSLTYQEIPIEELTSRSLNTVEARRRELFDAYIQRMFNRPGRKQSYDNEQTRQRLSWLARNMQWHNQDVFLIEGLQPSWLSTRFRRLMYVLASRLSVGLIAGPIGGLIFGLSFQLSFGLIEGVKRGLVQGLMGGLLLGLIVGLIDAIWIERHGKRVTTVSQASKPWKAVVNIIFVGLSVWLSFALISWLILGSIHWLNYGSDFWGPEGLVVGLLFGVSAGAIFGPRANRQSTMNDIETVESLSWSKRQAISWGAFGLMIGLPIGLLSGLIEKRFPGVTPFSLPLHRANMNILPMFMLIDSLIGGVVGTIVGGLKGRTLETKIAPNQGIRLSVMNAAFAGLVGGLGFGLTLGTIGILISILGPFNLHGIIVNGLSYGLHGIFVGLLMALWYGGLNVIQHYTLRLILIMQGHTPRDYARFLDYAVERIFLQKVGGGYRFIHRLLLEHFAEMYESKETSR